MSVLDSLSTTESGGNTAAYNNEVGHGGVRGHGGRLQFGHARLQDAAAAGLVPRGMTPAQFAQLSGDEQAIVEDWHKRDILKQAESRGLTQYIGQTINGTEITPDAIVAMAHLGGVGGASQYLRSGGAHNPSDSFGTSLSDYARKHGGASGNALSQPQAATGQQPAGNALAAPQPPQRPQLQFQTNTLDAGAFQQPMRQNVLQPIDGQQYTARR